jgi:hypothetical protein
MRTTRDLKHQNKPYQGVGDQTWTKQEIEECVNAWNCTIGI